MKSPHLLLAGLALASFSIVHAQVDATISASEQVIQDAGQPRVFEIATDEVHLDDASGPGETVAIRAGNAEAARREAIVLGQARRKEARLVLYEKGAARTDAQRRILTRLITARLRPGTDPVKIARRHRLVYRGPAPAGDYAIFEATRTGRAGGRESAAGLGGGHQRGAGTGPATGEEADSKRHFL